MKKIAIIFIILIFVICAYFGFKAASKIMPFNNDATFNDPVSNDATAVQQHNYLLIHVNDLTVEDPQLISVWAAFVYSSTPPQLIFIPLFPAYDLKIHERLDQKFGLNANRTLDAKFISQVNNSFDIQITGYLLVDDTTIQNSNLWLTGQDSTLLPAAAVTDQEKLIIRMNGQSAYQAFCQLVAGGTSKAFFSSIDWTLLLPDHFLTNIPFETIALTTDQIIRASTPVRCDVLSSE